MSMMVDPYRFVVPDNPALPDLPLPGSLRYWFMADRDVYSDAAGVVPCVNGGRVYNWLNQGTSADDAVQATAALRPYFRTGGHNGKPYIEGIAADKLRFGALLDGDQPTGIISYNNYTVFFVIAKPDTTHSTIFGSSDSSVAVKKSTVDLIDNSGSLACRFFKPEVKINLSDQTPNGLNIFCARKRAGSAGYFGYARNDHNNVSYEQNTNAPSNSNANMPFLYRPYSSVTGTFDGRIYEVLYYSGDIGATHIATVMNYLRTKYGLPTV